MILFSTKKYKYLKKEFLKNDFFKKGKVEEKKFSDGEKYTRIITKFKNKNVAVLGGTLDDEDIMDIYNLSCALVKLGAKSLTIIIPFFGYSTMERGELDGEIVKSKTRARLLSLIPTAYQGNNIILVDLHKEGISHYFENSVHTININTNQLMEEEIKKLKLKKYAIGATDEGGAKRVRKIADKLGVDAYFVLKRRDGNNVNLETSNNIKKNTKTMIIIDDMIRSGGTITQAIEAFSKEGVENFIVIATHGIFCDNGFKKLQKDSRIKKIIVSKSHIGSNNKNVKYMDITKNIIKELKEIIDE